MKRPLPAVLHERQHNLTGTIIVAAFTTAIGVVAALSLSIEAHAQSADDGDIIVSAPARGGGSPFVRVFEQLDANADGVATPEELMAMRERVFGQFDADANGELTQQEIESAMRQRAQGERGRTPPPPRGDRFAALDVDGSGTLSKQEFVQARGPLLERLDANGDGAITRTEAENARISFRDLRQRAGGLFGSGN